MPRPLPRLAGLLVALAVAAAPLPAAVADSRPPTAAELDAHRAQAQQLDAEAQGHARAVADARRRVSELAAQAGAAMERHQEALRQADEAEAERDLQEQRLAVAEEVLAGNRSDLGRWASGAYREGGSMARYEELMTLLEAESSDDLAQRLAILHSVGRVRGSAVEVALQAEEVQQDATRRSRAAARAAAEAVHRAATARAEGEALLEAQRTQLAALDALLERTRRDAEDAEARAAQMALVRAAAEQRRLAAADGRRGANAVTGPVGDCAGGPVHHYANGTIPLAALCPLDAAPGHRLRADAANAFDQLAQAYRAEFGRTICVTDSYRPLQSQVRLFATKPDLAAVPGTSNHGWGTAVDLCDGVERFGTAEHEWMRVNAPLYGWFHPSWAQAGGSRPEPWHWEFGG